MASPYYSASPAPPLTSSNEGTLPWPYVSQWSSEHQTTFYVNVETGESSWTPPDPATTSSRGPPTPYIQAAQAYEANGVDSSYGGGAGGDPSPYNNGKYVTGAANNGYNNTRSGPSVGGGGEASSFFSGTGTAPQAASSTSSSGQAPPQQQYDENGQPIEGGERGIGKVLITGGLAYFAYKMYKDYQRGRHNQQHYRPPTSGPPQGFGGGGGGFLSSFRPQGGGFGGAPMPQWDQKPSRDVNLPPSSSSPYPGQGYYGAAPPNDYNPPYPSEPAYSQPNTSFESNYSQAPPPQASYPQASCGNGYDSGYNPPPVTSYQSYDQPPPQYGQQESYSHNFQGSGGYGSGAPHKSAWGDPRFS